MGRLVRGMETVLGRSCRLQAFTEASPTARRLVRLRGGPAQWGPGTGL